jgi:hypothetical protein
MVRLDVRVGPCGQARQIEALDAVAKQTARQNQGVKPRLCEVLPADAVTFEVEKPQIERGVVGHHHVIGHELDEPLHHLVDARLTDEHLVADTRDPHDRRRDLMARVHKGGEALEDLAAPHAHRADLGDLRLSGRTTGRLQINHAVGGLTDLGGGPPGGSQPHQIPATPGEALVRVDDLGDESSLERLRALSHPQHLGDHVADLKRPATTDQQIAEPISQCFLAFTARLRLWKRKLQLEDVGCHGFAIVDRPCGRPSRRAD